MALQKVLLLFISSILALQIAALATGGRPHQLVKPYKRQALQDIVTWDEYSIFVRGKRVLFYSGEFHPFRLPVPSSWLDIFQKIKALGYSGVSFYSNWALLEGQEGNFTAEGVFAFEPFFQAASEAGIYLLARPGPYINAEVSGGGFPGWLQRTKAILRTPAYLNYTNNYVSHIGAIIAKAQITNGGPVILLQPENEYSNATNDVLFPNHEYFAAVEEQYRQAGIIVPFISNDAGPNGYFAPGNGTGAVDIYGHDSYPLGFDCANPTVWPQGALPLKFRTLHEQQSPTTPYSVVEFQGGSFDPWGGTGFAKCEQLLNEQFERVFYKNDFSFVVTVFNIYMTYGGTNWGNLGYAGGYTSYDYGAAIAENRTISREKYSEAKLEANFLMASPAYLTAVPTMNATNGSFVNTNLIATTLLKSNLTGFYVVRHAYYNSTASTNYRLNVATSQGSVSIPQLSSTLTLNGRDSKIHVTDYDMNGTNLLYSSAEIFTWKSYGSKTVLILYGGANETHEAAFTTSSNASIVEGSGVETQSSSESLILNWAVTPARKVVQIGQDLLVYLLDRNEAYNYWVLNLPNEAPVYNFTDSSNTAVIIKAGYLLRTADIVGQTLSLTGDVNETTLIEAVGAPSSISALSFNEQVLPSTQTSYGVFTANVTYNCPGIILPNLGSLTWKVIDSLPEIQPSYDDSAWTNADHTSTENPRNLTTPTSLYGSDYGYDVGNLLFRGHFTTTGTEDQLTLRVVGGLAFGYSVWLNSTFLGSWPGISIDEDYNQTLSVPKLPADQPAVITLLQENMGLDEENLVGSNDMKTPRGILSYSLSGHAATDVSWKITGNLGGENYIDKARGPLNEGGLYAERQGYHLPDPPSSDWTASKPTDGISGAGVNFYTITFDLDLPAGYDVPLSFQFTNSTTNGATVSSYRSLLFVNGYQFGKYVNNIGPQTTFPVPEGILNYHGVNYIALSLWSLDAGGAKVEDLQLISDTVIQSGFGPVELSPMPAYTPRPGAY